MSAQQPAIQSLSRSTDSVLPVRPGEPDYRAHQDHADHRVELVEVFAQSAPVFTELHAQPGQHKAPRPGSKKGIEMEASAGHACDSCGQGDEGAYHRQQSPDEDGEITPAGEKTISPIQFAPAHQDPAAVFFYQRAPAVASDFVRDQR